MRIAVIADIHGNDLALDAVLEDISRQAVDLTVNLGDCFSGPLNAGRVADILLAHEFPTVMGNHDRALVDQPADVMGDWERPAFAQLTDAHLAWIRELPFDRVVADDIYLCHATPKDDNTYWLETLSRDGHFHLNARTEIERMAEGIDHKLILCGHTHIPRAVQVSRNRLIVNPGSVGCPGYDYDRPWYHKAEAGNPFASYALVEKRPLGWQPEFRQVRYDNQSAARQAHEMGFEDWAKALAAGWL